MQQIQSSDWSSNYFSVYYLLNPDANVKMVEKALTDVVSSNREDKNTPFYFWLQPLSDIHFHSIELLADT